MPPPAPPSSSVGEAMSKQMKRAELKQESIRHTLEKLSSESSGLIMFTVQWKDLEDHFELARGEIRRGIEEIEASEARLGEETRCVDEKIKELDEKMGEVREREAREATVTREMARVVEKEREVVEMESAVLRLEEELESRKNELAFREMEAVRRFEDVRLQEKEFEVRLGEFEMEKREFEEKCKAFESRADDLGFREMEVMKRFEEVLLQEKEFEVKFVQSEMEKREFEEKSKEFELKGKELGFRETELMKRLDEVERKEEEFEVILNQLNMGKRELEKKQNAFEVRAKRRIENLEAREKDSEIATVEVFKRFDDVELKEKQFVENVNGFKRKEVELEEKFKEIKLKVEQLDDKEAMVARKMMLVEKRESKLSSMESMAAKVKEVLKSRKNKLVSWEMEVMKRIEVVQLKEEEFDFNHDQLQKEKRELKEKLEEFESNATRQLKELESKEQDLELSKRELGKQCDEVQMKEEEFEDVVNRFKMKEREFEEKIKEIEFREQQFKDAISNQQSLSLATAVPIQAQENEPDYVKQCNNRSSKEHKFKEIQSLGSVCPVIVKTEPLGDLMADNNSNDASLTFHLKMDGKTLQMFLNDRYDDHETTRDEVFYALKLSRDPARLVLDAMHGFFPPHLKKGTAEYETRVVRSSCVLLLEQLLKVNPSLNDTTKQLARKLAVEWREKMKSGRESYAVVLGFLLLTAVFRLSAEFDKIELERLLGMVHMDLARQLYPSLGFSAGSSAQGDEKNGNISEPTPTTVTEIARKRAASASATTSGTQPLEQSPEKRPKVAFHSSGTSNERSCIQSTVEISKQHPPVPCSILLAKNHTLEKSNALNDNDKLKAPVDVYVVDSRNELDSSCEKMDANCQVKSSSEVFAFNYDQLQLIKEQGSDAVGTSLVGSGREVDSLCEKLDVTHRASSASEVAAVKSDQPPMKTKQIGDTSSLWSCDPRHDVKYICIRMDAVRLRSYLVAHEKDQNLPKQVLDALRYASDPAKLVFNVVQGFYLPSFGIIKEDVNKASCILLLEQMMQLSPDIATELHNEALKCAMQRKATFAKESNVAVDVFGFLMFVAAYRLGSYFGKWKLVALFDTFYNDYEVYRLEQNVKLCRALSFEGCIPGFVKSLVKKNKRLHAIRYICAFNLVSRFSIFRLLRFHVDAFANEIRNCKKGADEAQLFKELVLREIGELRGLVKCIFYCWWLDGKNFLTTVEQRIDKLLHVMLKGEKNPPAISPAKHDEISPSTNPEITQNVTISTVPSSVPEQSGIHSTVRSTELHPQAHCSTAPVPNLALKHLKNVIATTPSMAHSTGSRLQFSRSQSSGGPSSSVPGPQMYLYASHIPPSTLTNPSISTGRGQLASAGTYRGIGRSLIPTGPVLHHPRQQPPYGLQRFYPPPAS